ncbi:hypothetical protein FACS1894122_04310 [Alphaproteobacteria bacterium]|nr:hypothetical protein FACS1894122_04310 [Alphaproteobacteria bacterium]
MLCFLIWHSLLVYATDIPDERLILATGDSEGGLDANEKVILYDGLENEKLKVDKTDGGGGKWTGSGTDRTPTATVFTIGYEDNTISTSPYTATLKKKSGDINTVTLSFKTDKNINANHANNKDVTNLGELTGSTTHSIDFPVPSKIYTIGGQIISTSPARSFFFGKNLNIYAMHSGDNSGFDPSAGNTSYQTKLSSNASGKVAWKNAGTFIFNGGFASVETSNGEAHWANSGNIISASNKWISPTWPNGNNLNAYANGASGAAWLNTGTIKSTHYAHLYAASKNSGNAVWTNYNSGNIKLRHGGSLRAMCGVLNDNGTVKTTAPGNATWLNKTGGRIESAFDHLDTYALATDGLAYWTNCGPLKSEFTLDAHADGTEGATWKNYSSIEITDDRSDTYNSHLYANSTKGASEWTNNGFITFLGSGTWALSSDRASLDKQPDKLTAYASGGTNARWTNKGTITIEKDGVDMHANSGSGSADWVNEGVINVRKDLADMYADSAKGASTWKNMKSIDIAGKLTAYAKGKDSVNWTNDGSIIGRNQADMYASSTTAVAKWANEKSINIVSGKFTAYAGGYNAFWTNNGKLGMDGGGDIYALSTNPNAENKTIWENNGVLYANETVRAFAQGKNHSWINGNKAKIPAEDRNYVNVDDGKAKIYVDGGRFEIGAFDANQKGDDAYIDEYGIARLMNGNYAQNYGTIAVRSNLTNSNTPQSIILRSDLYNYGTVDLSQAGYLDFKEHKIINGISGIDPDFVPNVRANEESNDKKYGTKNNFGEENEISTENPKYYKNAACHDLYDEDFRKFCYVDIKDFQHEFDIKLRGNVSINNLGDIVRGVKDQRSSTANHGSPDAFGNYDALKNSFGPSDIDEFGNIKKESLDRTLVELGVIVPGIPKYDQVTVVPLGISSRQVPPMNIKGVNGYYAYYDADGKIFYASDNIIPGNNYIYRREDSMGRGLDDHDHWVDRAIYVGLEEDKGKGPTERSEIIVNLVNRENRGTMDSLLATARNYASVTALGALNRLTADIIKNIGEAQTASNIYANLNAAKSFFSDITTASTANDVHGHFADAIQKIEATSDVIEPLNIVKNAINSAKTTNTQLESIWEYLNDGKKLARKALLDCDPLRTDVDSLLPANMDVNDALGIAKENVRNTITNSSDAKIAKYNAALNILSDECKTIAGSAFTKAKAEFNAYANSHAGTIVNDAKKAISIGRDMATDDTVKRQLDAIIKTVNDKATAIQAFENAGALIYGTNNIDGFSAISTIDATIGALGSNSFGGTLEILKKIGDSNSTLISDAFTACADDTLTAPLTSDVTYVGAINVAKKTIEEKKLEHVRAREQSDIIDYLLDPNKLAIRALSEAKEMITSIVSEPNAAGATLLGLDLDNSNVARSIVADSLNNAKVAMRDLEGGVAFNLRKYGAEAYKAFSTRPDGVENITGSDAAGNAAAAVYVEQANDELKKLENITDNTSEHDVFQILSTATAALHAAPEETGISEESREKINSYLAIVKNIHVNLEHNLAFNGGIYSIAGYKTGYVNYDKFDDSNAGSYIGDVEDVSKRVIINQFAKDYDVTYTNGKYNTEEDGGNRFKKGVDYIYYAGNNSWYNGIFNLNGGGLQTTDANGQITKYGTVAEFSPNSALFGGDINAEDGAQIIWHGGAKNPNNRPTITLYRNSDLMFDFPLGRNSIFSEYATIKSDPHKDQNKADTVSASDSYFHPASVHLNKGTLYIKGDNSGFMGDIYAEDKAKFIVKSRRNGIKVVNGVGESGGVVVPWINPNGYIYQGIMFGGTLRLEDENQIATVETSETMKSTLAVPRGTLQIDAITSNSEEAPKKKVHDLIIGGAKKENASSNDIYGAYARCFVNFSGADLGAKNEEGSDDGKIDVIGKRSVLKVREDTRINNLTVDGGVLRLRPTAEYKGINDTNPKLMLTGLTKFGSTLETSSKFVNGYSYDGDAANFTTIDSIEDNDGNYAGVVNVNVEKLKINEYMNWNLNIKPDISKNGLICDPDNRDHDVAQYLAQSSPSDNLNIRDVELNNGGEHGKIVLNMLNFQESPFKPNEDSLVEKYVFNVMTCAEGSSITRTPELSSAYTYITGNIGDSVENMVIHNDHTPPAGLNYYSLRTMLDNTTHSNTVLGFLVLELEKPDGDPEYPSVPEFGEPDIGDTAPVETVSFIKPCMPALSDEPLLASDLPEKMSILSPDLPPSPTPECHEPDGEDDVYDADVSWNSIVRNANTQTHSDEEKCLVMSINYELRQQQESTKISVFSMMNSASHYVISPAQQIVGPWEAVSWKKPPMPILPGEPLSAPYTAENIEIDRMPDEPPQPVSESHEPDGEDEVYDVDAAWDSMIRNQNTQTHNDEECAVLSIDYGLRQQQEYTVISAFSMLNTASHWVIPPAQRVVGPWEAAPWQKPPMPILPYELLPASYTTEDIEVDLTPDTPPQSVSESHEPDGEDDSLKVAMKDEELDKDGDTVPLESASITKPSMPMLPAEPLPTSYTAEDIEIDQMPNEPPQPVSESHEPDGEDDSLKVAMKDEELDKDGVHGNDGDTAPVESVPFTKPSMPMLPYEPLPASYTTEDVEVDLTPDTPPQPVSESHEPDGEDEVYDVDAAWDSMIRNQNTQTHDDEECAVLSIDYGLRQQQEYTIISAFSMLNTASHWIIPPAQRIVGPWEAAPWQKPPMPILPYEPLPASYTAEDIEVDQTPDEPPQSVPESHEPSGEDDSLKVAMKDENLDKDGVHGDDGNTAPVESAPFTKPSMPILPAEPLSASYTTEDIEINRTPDEPPQPVSESHEPDSEDEILEGDEKIIDEGDGTEGNNVDAGDMAPVETASFMKPSIPILPYEPLPAPYTAEDIEIDRTPDEPPQSVPESHEPDGEDDSLKVVMKDENLDKDGVHGDDGDTAPVESAPFTKPPMPILPDEPLPASYTAEDIEIDQTPDEPPQSVPESHEPSGEDDSLKVATKDDVLDRDGVHGDDGDIAPVETAPITKPSMPILPDEPLSAPYTPEDIELYLGPGVPPGPVPESHEPSGEGDSLEVATEDEELDRDGVHGDDGDIAPVETAPITKPSMPILPGEPFPEVLRNDPIVIRPRERELLAEEEPDGEGEEKKMDDAPPLPPYRPGVELMHVTNIPDIYDAISGMFDCAPLCSDDLSCSKGDKSGNGAIHEAIGKRLFWNRSFSISSTLGVHGRPAGIYSKGYVTIFGYDERPQKTKKGYLFMPTIFAGYTKANLKHSDYLNGNYSGAIIGGKLSLFNQKCCGFNEDSHFKLDLIGSYQLLNTGNEWSYAPLSKDEENREIEKAGLSEWQLEDQDRYRNAIRDYRRNTTGSVDIRSHLFSIGAKAIGCIPLARNLTLIPSVSGDYSFVMTEDTDYFLKNKDTNTITSCNLRNKNFHSANAALGLASQLGNEKQGANIGVKLNHRFGGSQKGATDYGDVNYIGKTRNSVEYNASIHKRCQNGQLIIGVSKKAGARNGFALKVEMSFKI